MESSLPFSFDGDRRHLWGQPETVSIEEMARVKASNHAPLSIAAS